MALSCEEIHEQITAYVDDRVDEAQYRQKVAAHIESCSACRDEYEREIMTKMVIRQRFPLVGTPTELRSSIVEGLDTASRAGTATRRASSSYRSRSRSSGLSIFFLLLVVAGLATYILIFDDSDPAPQPAQTQGQGVSTGRSRSVSTPTRRATGPANPFNLAIDNFQNIRAGQFELNPQTSDFSQLKSAFSGQGVSTIAFAGLSLPLKGGRVITHDGVPLPHLVYGDDKVTLYLYEVSWENLQNGKGVFITPDVAQKLEGGEPVWVPVSNDANLVMYKNGDVVDVVVANRPPAEMKRLLGLTA